MGYDRNGDRTVHRIQASGTGIWRVRGRVWLEHHFKDSPPIDEAGEATANKSNR